jgi:pyruvate formate lyase activating enzyme
MGASTPRLSPHAKVEDDPVAVKGFLETSFLDWPGKVVSVVFLAGCNFRCPFCHNHGLVLSPETYETIPLAYVLDRLEDLHGWLDGVCVTGGEPTLHNGLRRLLEMVKARDLQVKLDTNGYRPAILRRLIQLGLVDCVAMDVKAPLDAEAYSKVAGVPIAIDKINESISFLIHSGLDCYFRTTVVPAFHGEEDLLLMARQLSGASSLTLQNFNPEDPLDPALRGGQAYTEEWLARVQERITSILEAA